MEVRMDSPNKLQKYKSIKKTKVQSTKQKSTKIQKRKKNAKNTKNKRKKSKNTKNIKKAKNNYASFQYLNTCLENKQKFTPTRVKIIMAMYTNIT